MGGMESQLFSCGVPPHLDKLRLSVLGRVTAVQYGPTSVCGDSYQGSNNENTIVLLVTDSRTRSWGCAIMAI